MNRLKSYFLFSKEHRSGIVLLLILIGVTQLSYYWYSNSNISDKPKDDKAWLLVQN